MSDMPERIYMRDDSYGWPEQTDSGDPCGFEYVRADLAAKREADMAKLLLYAECPECDGSGVKEIDAGGELAQCQWCCERDEALATHDQTDDGGLRHE